MNILKQLYCNQYYELKPQGKEASALDNGTKLVTIALVLYALSISFLLILIFPDLKDFFEDILQDIFGRRSGRTIGQIIAALFFASFYFLVKLTLGKKESYENTIAEFETLVEEEQKKISKNGLIFFVLGIGIFAVSMILFFIFS